MDGENSGAAHDMAQIQGGANASEIRPDENNETLGAAPDAARAGYVTSMCCMGAMTG
eukprot:jgi/Botrbrau1/14671/Bobra.0108s0029.1